MWTVNKHTGLRKRVQCHLPSVLGKGKACNSGIAPRRTLSKQSLRGQVSDKLTSEICINNASSNSRLTAAGRWATDTDRHSQTFLQTLFFSPFLWWDNNWTTPACWKTYWTCTAFELGTLCGIFLFGLVWFGFSPLWWDEDRTTSETPSPGLEAQGWTPKLLRLKLYWIWTWRFFFFYYHFFLIFIVISILSLSL
jgi:hypothetical protein